MDDTLQRENASRLSVTALIEFAAAFSVITLVAGYIWIHIVITVTGAPEQIITISDYAMAGVSGSLLASSISLVSTLSWAITMPWEKDLPPRRLTLLLWLFISISAIAAPIAIGASFYFGLSTTIGVTVATLLSGVGRALTIAIVFLAALKLGPIKANALTLTLVVAAAVWANSVMGAVGYAARAYVPLSPKAKVVRYIFASREIPVDVWYPLLVTEHFYYFARRDSGEIAVLKSEDLQAVSKP